MRLRVHPRGVAAGAGRRAAVAAVAAVLLAACGGGSADDSPEGVLRDTARKLDDIRSGSVDLRLTAQSAKSEAVGFRMKGRFALPKEQGLPVADVELTELRGKENETFRFVSTGKEAFVVRDGKPVRLEGTGGVDVGGEGGGLGELRIDGWLRDPAMSEEDGAYRITSALNVAQAFDDLGRLGERLKTPALAGLRPLDARSREQLEKAAADSTVEVLAGKEDRLLRELVVKVTLTAAGEVPEGLKALVPVTLLLELRLDSVNDPVEVSPPGT